MLQEVKEKIEGGLRTRGGRKSSREGMPLISLITVVFNGAATLEHTIHSVIEQTYDNIEYIIIDGGSTDSTLDILGKYDEKIDYWISEKDKGIYDAINKGITLASGEYIGLLHSNDYFANPTAVEIIVANIKASNADAVFSNLDIVDPANLSRVLRKYRISSFTPLMLRIGVMPPHPTFYCKKSCYEKAGLYCTDYRIAADFEMLTRLLIKHHITWQYINETTVKMRSGGLSSSGLMASWVVNREIIRACTENGLYTNIFVLALKLPIRLMERIL